LIFKKLVKNLLPESFLEFYRKNLKKFHGNEYLDKKMLKYINYNNGFYIELGAHDGVINSNTFYYERKLNWSGILIEPSNYYEKLKTNRSKKNFFYNKLCVPFNFKKKEIEFDELGPYSKSSILSSDIYNKWHEKKSKQVDKIYKLNKGKVVSTTTLNDLLIESDAPKFIDFFSLDVEGSELNVLKGIDFECYNFKFLLIEITDIDEGKYVSEIKKFLRDKNYILVDNLTSYDYLFKYNV
tara:strand:+ start:77 stop:796 length:720 start_codon:yes stop_codon:yes gene_type:complete